MVRDGEDKRAGSCGVREEISEQTGVGVMMIIRRRQVCWGVRFSFLVTSEIRLLINIFSENELHLTLTLLLNG